MTRSAGYNLFLECEKGSPEGDRCIKAWKVNRDKLPSHPKMKEMVQAEGTGGQEVGTDLKEL